MTQSLDVTRDYYGNYTYLNGSAEHVMWGTLLQVWLLLKTEFHGARQEWHSIIWNYKYSFSQKH